MKSAATARRAKASSESRRVARVLSVQADLSYADEKDRELIKILRDLGWKAAYYRNMMIRAVFAQAAGWRHPDMQDDANSPQKHFRKACNPGLSGDVYSAAEMEVQAVWKRDRNKILAGQPLPEWRPDSALCISGKENLDSSGIRFLREEDGRYAIRLRVWKKQPGQTENANWITIPIKKNTATDKYQCDALAEMAQGRIPIKRATVSVMPKGKVLVRMTYMLEQPPLPVPGERVAVIGPADGRGRLMLRIENSQTVDFSREISLIFQRYAEWDEIRRRAFLQIGRAKGSAKKKRRALALKAYGSWVHDHLHQWTRKIIDWCASQGVGEIRLAGLDVGGWPYWKFRQMLEYKGKSRGISVSEGSDLVPDAAARAFWQEVRRRAEAARRCREALTTLKFHLSNEFEPLAE